MKWIMLMAMALLSFNISSFAQIKGYSGIWKIDTERSDFGELEKDRGAPQSMVVNLMGDSISVVRSFGDKAPYVDVLTFGAVHKEEVTPDGNTLRKTKVKWSKDKSVLIFDWDYEVGDNEWRYTRTETWSLSSDGKELIVFRVTTLPGKTDKVNAVYVRLKEN